ncbi:MAG: toxic anion resistance protein, partial [Firmicutes bacterium]|nr:toxic anion resistance protein [Bacillota bacterium]
MEENIFDTNVPSLTLDGATAAAEAPSESAASPELQSFDVKVKEAAAEVIDESMLTDAEKKVVDDFVKKIDIRDSTVVMQYGSAAQTKVSQFSDSTLEKVRTKDLGEIGDTITNLVNQLKGLSIDEDEKGIKSFFKRSSNKLSTMKTKYEKAEVNVDSICKVLQDHQVTLLHDIATLDKLYATNLDYQKELTMYIIAGKKKLKLERETTLSDLMKKAADSGLAE